MVCCCCCSKDCLDRLLHGSVSSRHDDGLLSAHSNASSRRESSFCRWLFVVLFRRIEVVYCACSGTETAVRWSGYADGAIESGQRCASEVLGRKFDFAARPAPTLMRNAPLGFSRTERLLPKLRSLILGAALLATALACKLFLL